MYKITHILSTFFLFVILSGFTVCYGQNAGSEAPSYPAGARPDIPGALGVEFGFMVVPDFPAEMELNPIGSSMFSGYYKYDINIGESNFSVHPGLEISFSKFSFKKDVTLVSQQAGDDFETILVGLDSVSPGTNFKKSLLKSTYIEIPLEVTFRTNRQFPKRSFKITLGAKAGYLVSAKTKIKFLEDGQDKITKQKEKYNLKPFKVTLVGKIGLGKIGLFYNYDMLPLFNDDKGPSKTTAATMSIGLSLDLF